MSSPEKNTEPAAVATEERGSLLTVRGMKVHFPIEEGILIKRKVGAIRAVDGIDFEIHRGRTLGLVGESGCGKSTTARAVAQLIPPDEGEVIMDGVDLTKAGKQELLKARMNIQMVFQDPYASLNPRMTAGDIIAEPLRVFVNRGLLDLSKEVIRDEVGSLMERVGLSAAFRNRYPHEFSGGQRQRIGVARALALHPKIILADEPVSALDVSIQSQILNLLTDLQDEFDLTYLFIAHDLAVIRHISDEVAVMYLGKIVEIAESDDLYKKPLHPYTEALLSAVPIPDPKVEATRKRIILTGDVRCPKRMDKCRDTVPRLKEVAPNHKVACFLYFEPEDQS